ncbi:VIT1/CCC1 transporter family protein [Pseudoxanthomonas daejeonensis]|uniref:VIT1/CCC1 transporter family protein n=1 Tax=Pseudoxanthomonas daejeonensis TaxID=266062 RepID=UPI001F541F02|nr:VIT1/CCC1 transporter family protein [Pseudoxanthomonas daejeonensis]UNK56364.1 VIT1/CCC1 transporter family protein [Pseudoxanthomonas daejeonensis]
MRAILPESRRILDPAERAAEILFGVIMTMTFTGTLSVAEAGRDDVRVMFIGALGCNIAWGLIDGIIYLMACRAERSEELRTFRAVRDARDPVQARAAIAAAMPPLLAELIREDEVEALRERLAAVPEPPDHGRLTRRDWLGALAVGLLVVFTTFPLALPFLLLDHVGPAMRLSNAIALVMLFLAGVVYARSIGRPALRVGLGMAALGVVLAVLTIALGG